MSENSSTPCAASATSSTTAADGGRRWSLAARLTAWYAGSTFIMILATTCFLYWAVVSTLEQEDDQYLLDKARVLLATLRDQRDNERELKNEVERESGPRPAGQIFIRVLDSAGHTIAETEGMSERLPPEQFLAPADLEVDTPRAAELHSLTGQSFRVLALRSPQGNVIVQVAMDRTAEEDLLGNYRWYAAAILSVALVVCATVGYALARQGLQPLRDITHATRRVQSSTLHQRLDLAGIPAELAELASTFNEMLDRLEDSFRRLERFSADIAHELRTPVHNLRGEAEVMLGQPRSPEQYREALASGLEEYDRLTGLIDSLLFLARAESPAAQINRESVDLAHELTTIREFYEPKAEDAGVTIEVRVANPIRINLDRMLLQRAVGNLIANALAHTSNGGRIDLTAERQNDMVTIEVADTGRGIAPEHLPQVFDRFYRADAARTADAGSVGLGLALVKSIAALHGGSCTIHSELGAGTKVRLTLPAATNN